MLHKLVYTLETYMYAITYL